MSWTVIASYSYPYEAQIAKSRLVSVGIPVYIENEHMVNTDWLYSNALGGVKLLVPEQFKKDALYLISHDFSQDVDSEFELNTPKCPKCNSDEIEPFTKGKRSAFFMTLILGFPIAKHEHGYKCKNCHEFFD